MGVSVGAGEKTRHSTEVCELWVFNKAVRLKYSKKRGLGGWISASARGELQIWSKRT
jgi:hypothetical protein